MGGKEGEREGENIDGQEEDDDDGEGQDALNLTWRTVR